MPSTKSSSADDSASDSDSEEVFPPNIEADIPGECTFCRTILYIVKKDPSEIRNHINVNIGPIAEIISSPCSQHKPLVDHFSETLKLEKTGALSIFRDYFSSSFCFSHRSDEAKFSETIASTADFNVLESNGLGVCLDPSWIDGNFISKWYDHCIASHGAKCSSPQYLQLLPPSKPDYFIDVIENCLVSAPANALYAALSYVWGRIKMMSTTNLNLAQLQQPGAFEDLQIQESLPRTVRHAMHLTTKLNGLRYLWVDALCIVQDDEEMLKFHLPQMGSIYGNASIVLTVMDGSDANYGLHGVEDAPDSVPRQIKQSTIPFGDETFVARHSMGGRPSISDPKRPYLDRGWTFQEHFFSRRRICFENDSIWFQCCDSTRYEDHNKFDLADSQRDWILNVGYPSITVFARLIKDFNKRQLSFPQDCLLACSGMMPCYSKIFTGGFVCGLPAMFIDAMLLWQPGSDLVRRVPNYNGKEEPADSNDICLPSWSWAGWQGAMDFSGWYTANDFVASCSGWIASSRCQTISTTKWHTSNSSHGTDRWEVDCLWTEWRERYKDSDIELPTGWTKRPKKRSETFTIDDSPGDYGEYIYQFNGSMNPTFWYPLPLSDPTGVSRPDENAKYLCGKVQTAHVYTFGSVFMSKTSSGLSSDAELPLISLSNAEGKWIGILRLHSADYLEKKDLDLVKERLEVQLLAISEGFVPNAMDWAERFVDEYDMEQRPKDGAKYEFVNVLWISWDGAVARREALGRVVKVYWDELGTEMIDIVLG
jgi:hypothetical protein